MKDIWRMRYRDAADIERESLNVLTGFNANIDHIYRFEDIDLDLDEYSPEDMDRVEGPEELKQVLKYCVEENENKEVLGRYMAREFPEAERNLGGQGGIIADFLSRMDHYSVLYTPLLSDRLTELMEEDIVYPVVEDGLKLKRIEEAVNTDRTKENMIVEIDEDKTCRLIVSDRLEGFGPYFRKGIENRLDKLDSDMDAFILSGFHDADGNFEAKIEKVKKQIERIESPLHMEYVDMDESKSEKILDDLLPEFNSIGMDEKEALEIAETKGMNFSDKLSLGEALQLSKKLLNDLDRVHIHTYRYHAVFTRKDYEVRKEKIRESMLYAEDCALRAADTGQIPESKGLEEFSLDSKHVHRLDELEEFQHHLDLNNFVEKGICSLEDVEVVAIPTLIHRDPERLVGMGDIISSATFTAELG